MTCGKKSLSFGMTGWCTFFKFSGFTDRILCFFQKTLGKVHTYVNAHIIFHKKHSFKKSGVLEVAPINHVCSSANCGCFDFSLVWKTVVFQENITDCKPSSMYPHKHKKVEVQIYLLGKAQ